MIAVLLVVSFVIAMMGWFPIRRYYWITTWGVALSSFWLFFEYHLQDVDGLGRAFVIVMVGAPMLAGALLGASITLYRRTKLGPGNVDSISLRWAISQLVLSTGLTYLLGVNL